MSAGGKRRIGAGSASFRQVDPSGWPDTENRPVAALRLEPQAIAERFGIEFETDADDLDRLQLAVIEVDGGQRFGLLRYDRNPSPGTAVLPDSGITVEEARATFLDALALGTTDLLSTANERA